MNVLALKQMIGARLSRSRQIEHGLEWSNPFSAELVRGGKVIASAKGYNGITVVGKNHLLDVVFGKATPVTQVNPWYIGLINQSPTPVLVEGDTLASHSGWVEFTGYSGNRQPWDDTDAANKVKGTSTVSTFTINATGTIYGILICAVATGTSGVLWATGGFDSALSVVNTDELKVTYGLRT